MASLRGGSPPGAPSIWTARLASGEGKASRRGQRGQVAAEDRAPTAHNCRSGERGQCLLYEAPVHLEINLADLHRAPIESSLHRRVPCGSVEHCASLCVDAAAFASRVGELDCEVESDERKLY